MASGIYTQFKADLMNKEVDLEAESKQENAPISKNRKKHLKKKKKRKS